MSDHLFGLIELVFVFAVVLGFGIWQLCSLKRDRSRENDDESSR